MVTDILKYEHIIWDFNGTLLDDVEKVISVMNMMLKKRSLPPISYESYQELFIFPVIDYYIALGFDFTEENFDDVAVEFIDEYFNDGFTCTLQEGVLDLLHLFEQNRITQSVLSVSKSEHLEKYLEILGIKHFFIQIHGQNDIHGRTKSEKGLEHIGSLNISPDKILLIGDTSHDLEVAVTINCDHLLVANGHQSKTRLLEKTHNVIDTLLDLV